MLPLIVGGKRLESAWHGPGPKQAPTLVFLHDGLGCVELWRDFPERLASATGCGALVYSRLGHGRSDPGGVERSSRFMHDEAKVLESVLDAAQIERAILVGHSDGGSIALIYSGSPSRLNSGSPSRHDAGSPGSERVVGVVAEAAHVFCEEKTRSSITACLHEYRHGMLRDRLERYHGENVDSAFGGWASAWLDAGFADWNIESYVARIRAPLLAIQGDADEYGTLAQIDAIAARCRAPFEKLVLPGVGHSPHREEPEKTLSAIVRFLAPILGAPSGRS